MNKTNEQDEPETSKQGTNSELMGVGDKNGKKGKGLVKEQYE